MDSEQILMVLRTQNTTSRCSEDIRGALSDHVTHCSLILKHDALSTGKSDKNKLQG